MSKRRWRYSARRKGEGRVLVCGEDGAKLRKSARVWQRKSDGVDAKRGVKSDTGTASLERWGGEVDRGRSLGWGWGQRGEEAEEGRREKASLDRPEAIPWASGQGSAQSLALSLPRTGSQEASQGEAGDGCEQRRQKERLLSIF